MSCRSGCKTKDHGSYAECLRAANVTTRVVSENSVRTQSDLDAYKSARANGIQPESTAASKVADAERASRLLGRAYDAEKDPPASMITKTTSKILKEVSE